MNPWKYTDENRTVADRTNDDGSYSSRLASALPPGQEILDPDPPSPDVIKSALEDAVQQHLDATARAHGYDGILSLCSYSIDPHLPYQLEGQAGAAWRGEVWNTCYAVLRDVQAGSRPIPTAAELLAELPAPVWPT